MTRRRAQGPQSSLELFLDTICNTFGGILFILLFVVLLLKMTQPPEQASAEAEASPTEYAQMVADLDTARLDWAAIQEEQQTLEDSAQKMLQPDTVTLYRELTELKNEVRELTLKIKSARDQAKSLEDEVARAAELLVKQQEELQQAQDELKNTESTLTQQEKQLEQKKSENQENQSLPQLRYSSNLEVALVLRYHRFYLWHNYDSTGERHGLNTEDFSVVKTEIGVAYTSPKPWKGIDMTDREAARIKIRQAIKRFDRTRVTLAIVCGDDSFDDYRFVRDIAKSLNFDIHPIPLSKDSGIADRGGTGQAQ